MNKALPRLILVASLALAGCGQSTIDAGNSPKPTADKSAAPAMPRSASPEGARVFFLILEDGATVSSPVTIEFGIEGMDVVRAGVAETHGGHHHLLVDADLPALDMPIPANDNYIHFGDASTSTTLELPAGQHTLRLLLGDHLHIPHDPPVSSETITITVE